ncbi:type 1 glutamine amidotransferase [Marivirga sp. S37H4]|uniref:Type 1 glutamine amidotransferase n=1 Tax=Marivirga aurantiaca TaxID=2802615 RepID=A0A934WXK2_9BACT|nr:type 1 glutamine amidotransferase domain-containing protein [Marivirga aurantiaca]MBK6264691.1 type 1 glutamine amidotransferase [Marivirga aurantiaca]
MGQLDNKKIAILTETGFEEIELTDPKQKLEEEGATVHIISPTKKLRSWHKGEWNLEMNADKLVNEVNASDYDGLMLPGGVINPDKLRRSSEAIEFIRHFLKNGKPIAAICHGAQSLIETGELKGRIMTSFPSIRTDLENAGVLWEDKEVVVDQGLTTSRSPDDLDAFNSKMIEEFAEGVHA